MQFSHGLGLMQHKIMQDSHEMSLILFFLFQEAVGRTDVYSVYSVYFVSNDYVIRSVTY